MNPRPSTFHDLLPSTLDKNLPSIDCLASVLRCPFAAIVSGTVNKRIFYLILNRFVKTKFGSSTSCGNIDFPKLTLRLVLGVNFTLIPVWQDCYIQGQSNVKQTKLKKIDCTWRANVPVLLRRFYFLLPRYQLPSLGLCSPVLLNPPSWAVY